MEDSEVGAKVGVLISPVTNIFRRVEAVGFTGWVEVDESATAFASPAPAIVWTLIDLLKVN